MLGRLTIVAVITAGLILAGGLVHVWAGDYDHRYVRNYPPGYYGMWYYSDRFFNQKRDDMGRVVEPYRWDRYMSRTTGLQFPFLPIPFGWEYGTGRTFNLPDYSQNPWY